VQISADKEIKGLRDAVQCPWLNGVNTVCFFGGWRNQTSAAYWREKQTETESEMVVCIKGVT